MSPRVLLTGANGVFGRHIAEGIVEAACDVICICRSKEKAETLVSALRAQYPTATVRYELCDVASHDDINTLAQRLGDDPIDILVNNAAITPTSRLETPAGIEQQWACNMLGYHWMIKALESNLLASSHTPARVINVASFYAGSLDLSDPEFKRRHYNSTRHIKPPNRRIVCRRGRMPSGTTRARWCSSHATPAWLPPLSVWAWGSTLTDRSKRRRTGL